MLYCSIGSRETIVARAIRLMTLATVSRFVKEKQRIVRAARSYEYNRARAPEVEARLERARTRLKSYLILHGLNSMRLGGYQLELTEGELVVTKLPPDGFEQLELQGFDTEKMVQQGSKETSDSGSGSSENP